MNKTVLITGCARGMGELMALRFAREGWQVVATDYDLPGLQAGSLAALPNVSIRELDVRNAQSWQAIFDEIEQAGQAIEVIINNAGVLLAFDAEKATTEDIDRQIDINVKGVILGSTLAARHMTARKNGHIINIASLAGITPVPGLSLYCASKFAVRGYTLSLAYELRDRGVHVTAICPDAVNTQMVKQHLHNEEAGMVFSGNLLRPEDVVNAVFKALKSNKMEVVLPWFRGSTARLNGLMPRLGLILKGLFTRQGLRRQEQMRKSLHNS